MKKDFMIEKEQLFETGNNEAIWKKYCGFLDLSLEEFMVIQKTLLKEQLQLVGNSGMANVILRGQKPETVEEFRRVVPFTTYRDYERFLGEKNEDVLAEKPAIWAHTSGRTGLIKWAPYTEDNLCRLAEDTLSAFILSSASKKGEVRLRPGAKVVLNLPPPPYTTGIMADVVAQKISYQAIPPLEAAERMQFQERIEEGFKTALVTGVDYAASIGVVLAKVGERFGQLGGSTKPDVKTWHPLAILRVLQAMVKSKLNKRPILPRDIWKIKGLVCGGTDTTIYKDEIAYYWGVEPLDVYIATETGFIAIQGWNKKGMTLVPFSNFYEFIPEEELLKSRVDKKYQPATVLLDEVEAGKTYEIVITNFHGAPFLRYRIGDLIRITSLSDEAMKVSLPQLAFVSRADEIIDIAGFARLDEKTIWTAIKNMAIPYEDWCARKEYLDGKSVLHLYLELKGNSLNSREVRHLLDEQLSALDKDYSDLKNMTETDPVVVTLVERGAFQQYMQEKQAEGFDLAHLKPPHINAPDAVIGSLLGVGDHSQHGGGYKSVYKRKVTEPNIV